MTSQRSQPGTAGDAAPRRRLGSPVTIGVPEPRAARPGLRRLLHYLGRHRGAYAGWAITTLGYVATFVAVPMLIGYAVAAAESGLPAAEVGRRCLWIVLVTLLRGGLRFYSRTMVFNLAREIEYELRNDLFAHLQRLPQSFYLRWRTGDLMSRCVNDLGSVRLLLGPGVLNLLQTPILYVAVFAAMLALDVEARPAGAAAVSGLPLHRAQLRTSHAPQQPAAPGGPGEPVQHAPGDDLRDRRGEGVRHGAGGRRSASRPSIAISTSGSSTW